MILLNVKQLAEKIGRSPSYVAAMKSFGYVFSHGTRTTELHAVNWLAEHPEFRSTGYQRNSAGFVKREDHPMRRRKHDRLPKAT